MESCFVSSALAVAPSFHVASTLAVSVFSASTSALRGGGLALSEPLATLRLILGMSELCLPFPQLPFEGQRVD